MTAPVRVLSQIGPVPAVDGIDGVQLTAIPSQGPPGPEVAGEVLLTVMRGTPNLEAVLATGVRWVHTIGTGVDEFPLHLLGGRVLTCSRGVNAVPIAEWVMAQLLTAEKRLPEMWVHAPPERWGLADLGGLAGRQLALVGLGTIGVAVAERALVFGMQVRALRRHVGPSPLPGVEVVGDLERLLAGADHIVLAAPLTPATHHLVDAAFLDLVTPGAHLVNVARGALIDEDALRRALDAGTLALASLDVATVEPPPPGHWLYAHPRVRFSPHVSWSGPGIWEGMQQAFADNLRRWLRHEPLAGVVDVEEGY